jgi:peptidoglycan/xylan/chitin deacetylase (PgdA/CDA1 family)
MKGNFVPQNVLISCALILGAGLLISAFASSAGADSNVPAKACPVIILKLDDIAQDPNGPIHPNWQRVTDYLEKNKIRAGMGIVCDSLEKDNPAYIKWIKDHHDKGLIEFWCHGYRSRTAEDKTGEFDVGTAAEQQAILEKCQKLAKEKLGFDLPAFGPHWSGTTDATDQALQAIPEIKIWLWGPAKPKFFTGLCIRRVVGLEDPIFVPDANKFQASYRRVGAREKVLVLQGHAAAWNDAGWAGFVKIIEFLQSQNCAFMTPSEYLKSLADDKKAK